jgi:hypothetical protein
MKKKRQSKKNNDSESKILKAAIEIINKKASILDEEEDLSDDVFAVPIDMESHINTMCETFEQEILNDKRWMLLDIRADYAIACFKLQCDVKFSNEDLISSLPLMQPYTDIKKKTFCVVRAFVWSDEAREAELINRLIEVGAEVKELYVIGDIKMALEK